MAFRFGMRIAAALLLASPALAPALAKALANAPAPFDRAAWQQDYAQLKQALEQSYANLAWEGSGAGGVDLPALDRYATDALARAQSDTQAMDAIRAFVAGFHDGHLSELPYLATAGSTRTVEPADPALSADDPVGGCAALGFASTAPVAFSLPFESLAGFNLISDGLSDTFRAGLLTPAPGVKLGLIRIQNFEAGPFPAACLHAWSDLVKAGTPITAGAVKDAASDRWFSDLADTARQLRQRGATAIVIDVGRNSGGNDSGDWTPRMFTDRQVRSARLLMVDASVAANYFDEQLTDLDAAIGKRPSVEALAALSRARTHFAAQKARIGRQGCDLSWVWREQRPWSLAACNRMLDAGYSGGFSAGLPRRAYNDAAVATTLSSASTVEAQFGTWTGPAYVLTDKRSFSAAEMFAAVMQDNHIAKIVGMPTGGDGCGFMTDGPPLVLTHSRLRFRMPNCLRLRADGSNEQAGITPDLPVLPTEGESARARAARAADLIATDIGQSRSLPAAARNP